MTSTSPRVILQSPDRGAGAWLCLESPVEVLVASSLRQVRSTLAAAEAAAEGGGIAAGFVAYEAAPAFDSALVVRSPGPLPLAWFGIFEHSRTVDRLPDWNAAAPTPSWRASITRDRYRRAVAAIRDHIAAGDTYQVNFTLRLDSHLAADPWHLFTSLCRGQRSRCCAFVDTGDWVLCSASPELFFELRDERIRSRPMKGTARRGRFAQEDELQAEALLGSAKDRAENVMIVDMVRNDLGRIALPETVIVEDLWRLEQYPSLFQLTSTIGARTRASVSEIFAALFPCASITGAPKVRAAQIIADLEDRPRGVYTGAIGAIGPGRRARFNVAIRTVQIDRRSGRAEYGTGGGIVWDSVADDEWRECRTKALVLRPSPPEFQLLETLSWRPDEGFFLLQRHLDRLAASAHFFGYPWDASSARTALASHARELPPRQHRTRLLLAADGTLSLASEPLTSRNSTWRVAVARAPVDSREAFLFHKTTHREVYDRHRRDFPDHDDVILWNEEGELTESTLANLVLRRQDRLLTPPVSCGLLAGTYRAELLARGEIHEQTLRLHDLATADEILLINSVRRWISTELDPATVRRTRSASSTLRPRAGGRD